MPDPELLPPGRDLHAVPLPPGTLSAIRAKARRRRAARTAAAGSAGLVFVAVAAAAVLTTGTNANDSLRLQPAVPATTVPTPQPQLQPTATTDAVPPPQAAVTQEDRDQDLARATPAPVAARPDRSTPPSAAQPPPPAADAQNRSTQDPQARRTDEGVVILKPDCGQASPEDIEGWCLEAEADPDDQSLSLAVCRAQDSPPGRLNWPNSQQVRFAIKDSSSNTIWTYDPKVTPQASAEEVPPGRCVGWQALWPGTDEQGHPLAPGTYTLLASTTADGLSSTVVTHRFKIG